MIMYLIHSISFSDHTSELLLYQYFHVTGALLAVIIWGIENVNIFKMYNIWIILMKMCLKIWKLFLT